jgi:hypothetical protein
VAFRPQGRWPPLWPVLPSWLASGPQPPGRRTATPTVNGVPVNLAGDAPVDCDTRQWPNSASNRTMGMGTPSIKSRIERIVSLLKTKLKTQAGTWIECPGTRHR